jgi:dethiobiotin synthetase
MENALGPSKLRMPGLMILGTDTDVGKTYVACRILEELVRQKIVVGAYKPVASGGSALEQGDAFRLWKASGCNRTLEQVNPQFFFAPLAPPVAAELEGRAVNDAKMLGGAIDWESHCEFLVVEGAGGLMSPLSLSTTCASLANSFGLPIVLVSANRLGVVNQVMTTLIAAQSLGLCVVCVVLNDVAVMDPHDHSVFTNERLLQAALDQMVNPPKLARLGFGKAEFCPPMDWHVFSVQCP